MEIGKLTFKNYTQAENLLAPVVLKAVKSHELNDVLVAEIDPSVSDTAAFCERYGVGMDISANCVVIEAKRAERVWYAACIILATTRADVNGVIRRRLGARKVSFAPMDKATGLTVMEYGAITPVGLPDDWPIFIDSQVAVTGHVIIGSGIRHSKLFIPGRLLEQLPNAMVMDITLPNKVQ